MIVIAAGAGVAQIDVATVEAEQQRERVAQLAAAARDAVRLPGCVSASVLRSLDGLRVATYAQWHSVEAAAASALPGSTYDVVHVQKAPGVGPTIVTGSDPLTLIVRMTCTAAEQAELVQYLIGIAVEHSTNPGFLSCTIHRSIDRGGVAEYIQWADKAALGAMAAKPASQAHFARVKPRSSSAMYEVVSIRESQPSAV